MATKGILLVNLGTPRSPEPEDVGTYLREFLMDPLVINLPWPLRFFLVNILIVPRRKFASSEKYKKIWTAQGSPLLLHLESLAHKMRPLFAKEDVEVKTAMRYGEPSLREALVSWKNNTPRKIVVVPLYPQYAEASSLSSIRAIETIAKEIELPTTLEFVPAFYQHPAFIEALAETTRNNLAFTPDHFLFSYHGLPKAQVMRVSTKASGCGTATNCCEKITAENKDCYRAQCFATSRALAQALNLDEKEWSLSFQSRLGRSEWIKPFSDHQLVELPKRGIKRLAVLCPSFVSDCLETLEEIAIEGRRTFISAGGEEFQLVPCVNSHEAWVKGLAKITRQYLD